MSARFLGRSRLSQSRLHRYPLSLSQRSIVTNSKVFQVSEEVEEALQTGKPVVALETTIYTHGFPYPENVALASHLESVVRVNGGIPATIGVLNGVARVGMGAEELIELTSSAGKDTTKKVSRRDLAWISGLGLNGTKINGGTTIAGTMVLAHLAGIKVFATGGLGGVHRGGESSMDISADLTELGRTPVTVISSGCKSFLDIGRTLEYLETQGVAVGTFADGRTGPVDFPAFYTRESGIKSPKVIRDEAEAAAIIYANSKYPLTSGLFLANPVPAEYSMSKESIDSIIDEAVRLADVEGFHGSDNTPFILDKIKKLSNGKSIIANKALIEGNVARGTKVAVELAKLELADKPILDRVYISKPYTSDSVPDIIGEELSSVTEVTPGMDVLVAGSLAVDLSCDFAPLSASAPLSPVLHTSNPSVIRQSIGGVGRNVAVAAAYAGARTALCSLVGDDLGGRSALVALSESGVLTSGVQTLPEPARTAQFVAVNDQKKDLVLAMADMSIMELDVDVDAISKSLLESAKPKWLVADANWNHDVLHKWLLAGKSAGAKVAFEPVSTAKSTRLFMKPGLKIVPDNSIDLITPNKNELSSIFSAARESEAFDKPGWWEVIDALGITSSGARDRMSMMTNASIVDEGIPQKSVQLLPYIPTIVTKLGSKGLLLTQLLRQDDIRLSSADHAPYILSRSGHDNALVGGVYMRLFGPAEIVAEEKIVSVNGVGDTLLGVLIAALTKNELTMETAIDIAQQGSVLTLQSPEAVSAEVKSLRRLL